MKKILMIHQNKAYLPELNSYKKYFNNSTDFQFYDCMDFPNYSTDDFDVLWYFMGVYPRAVRNKYIIHEYASLSSGNFPQLKNFIKKEINARPDLRIFLNENVRAGFSFNDDVSYLFRDMGVDESFFISNKNKEFDFVYIGELGHDRGMFNILNKFKYEILDKNILVIGDVPDYFFREFKESKNIIFTGRLNYYDIPSIACKAEFGLNYIVDKYPYNLQTSTKLLEYLAMGLKIVSTKYNWVLDFMRNIDGNFYFIDDYFGRKDIPKLYSFEYITPNISQYKWDAVLKRSRINEKLTEIVHA